jgi:hypothetical protein
MTADEHRAEAMRPYRALLCAIIAQAVEDVKYAGVCDRSQAAHWLMHSEVARELFETLDIDAEWFRDMLARTPWFRRASPVLPAIQSARVLNPLFPVSA